MIYSYEIKKINNEEILFLHMAFDMEFAKENEQKQKLVTTISEYLKSNKINFKGTRIAIVASGIVIGSLLLKNPVKKYEDVKLDNYVVAVVNDEFKNNSVTKEYLNIINDIQESKEKIHNTKSEPNKNYKKTEDKVSFNTNNNTLKEVVIEEPKIEVKEAVNAEINKDNNTYVTIKRKSGLITNIELEEYLVGVVGAEMPASFNIEALKAQAIIARTYAVSTLNKGKLLTDDSRTQNYKDNNELQKMWGNNFNTYYNKIKSAVTETEGIYLTYNGKIINAVYHSTSNGKTEDAMYVWGNSTPYLVSVESPYDTSSNSFNYEKFIAYPELSEKLKMEINKNTEFIILSRTSGGRIEKIQINDKVYSGIEIRSLLSLRSADFDITKEENGISFKTRGYGHGVGLSQYGANGMASVGYNYEQILKHYYTGIKLTKI